MSEASGGENVRGIGARLRAARERRGLTVLQAAEKLHVDARVLEALEAEDFTLLGADVFVRGHLRRYAEAVGESAEELQDLYADSAHPAFPDLTRIPRADSGKRSSPLMLPALLAVVGLALVGLLWWFVTQPGERAQPLTEALPAPRAGTAGGAAGPAATASGKAGATSGAGAVPAPGGAAAARGAVGAVPTTSAGQAQLDLKFSAVSWVQISDADGRRLLEGLFAPGSARDVSGTAPLRVVLGNAPAVALQLNGQPVSLAGLVHRNGSAYLTIDGDGRASAAASRLAHGY
jgi:cytoskeleton protein RodZ